MEKKVAAVLQYTDGVLCAVLGTRVEFSVQTATDLVQQLAVRKDVIKAKRAEQEAAAAKAAQLAAELEGLEPDYEQDTQDFSVLLRTLKDKLTEQGVAFPDERFREYITE